MGAVFVICAALIVLFTLVLPQRLLATTVLSQSFPDLVHKAEVIAVGTVASDIASIKFPNLRLRSFFCC